MYVSLNILILAQVFVSRGGQNGLCYEHTTAEAVILMNITNHVLHVA